MIKSREQFKRLIMFWSSIIIVLVQVLIFAWLWYGHYKDLMTVQYFRRGNWAIIGLYGILVYFFSKTFGALKVGYLRTWDVLYSQVLSVLCVNFIVYIQMELMGNWKFLHNFEPIIFMTMLDLTAVFVWAILMRFVYAKLFPPHTMLFVHGKISPKAMLDKLGTRQDKFHIEEMINISEGIDKVLERINEYDVILVGDIPAHERNVFIKYCFYNSKRCYCIPKISDIMIKSATNIDLFDTQLQLFRNQGLTVGQAFIKRLIDIIVSAAGCVIASPIMIIIALCIKLYDKGPVFYRQERLTFEGTPFMIYKFRSMIVNSEKKGARLASQHDDRITPVGRVIRRLHFDELPQLFNIIKGEMSIVGPRPEREEIYEEYEKEIPEFRYRLKMAAGLTGYAQVYGKYSTVPYDKLKLDLTYIENYSIWLDFKLMLLTVKILFQKEKSEGVDDKQTTAIKKEND